MKKAAVLLAGCGHRDGAEVREAVLTLLSLDVEGVEYEVFSLDQDQVDVVSHLSGEEKAEKRNIMEEAARIARGEVEPISKLDIEKFDGLFLPGGFGVAKNFCDFATQGANATVNPDVAKTIKAFHAAKKPIGAICISPALMGLVLGEHKPLITLGEGDDTAKEIEKTGARHQKCPAYDCVVDTENKIVSTPAYMIENPNLADIFSGIAKLVKASLTL